MTDRPRAKITNTRGDPWKAFDEACAKKREAEKQAVLARLRERYPFDDEILKTFITDDL